MPEWYFPNGTPWQIKALFASLMLVIALWLAVFFWAYSYAPHSPIPGCQIPFHIRGGRVSYLPPLADHWLHWGLGVWFVLWIVDAFALHWFEKRGIAVRRA